MTTINETSYPYGVVGRIFYDELAESPREDSNLTTIVSVGRHEFGDEHFANVGEFINDLAGTRGVEVLCEKCQSPVESEFGEYGDIIHVSGTDCDSSPVSIMFQGVTVKNIYMYSHSGTTISTKPFGCKWDSGLAGFVYILDATIESEFLSAEDVFDGRGGVQVGVIEAEVEEYDAFIKGEVYAYEITIDGDSVSSGYGFYNEDHAISEMQCQAEFYSSQDQAVKRAAENLIELGKRAKELNMLTDQAMEMLSKLGPAADAVADVLLNNKKED